MFQCSESRLSRSLAHHYFSFLRLRSNQSTRNPKAMQRKRTGITKPDESTERRRANPGRIEEESNKDSEEKHKSALRPETEIKSEPEERQVELQYDPTVQVQGDAFPKNID